MMGGMLSALAIALGFVAWGSHAVVPFHVAESSPEARNRWRLTGLPLALLALLAALTRNLLAPDAAIGAGLLPLAASRALPIALVLISLTLAVDALLMIARDGAEPLVWKLSAGIGLATLCATSAIEELLRIGGGPPMAIPAFVLAILVRAAIAIALVEGLLGRTSRFAPFAGAGLAGYFFLLPDTVRSRLIPDGDVLTFAAAALLFAAGRFVPERLRRMTLLSGAGLAALALGRAAQVSQAVGEKIHQVASLFSSP